MGNCIAGGNPEDREARSRSTAIDRQLREDRKEYENTIKILLLGESVFKLSTQYSYVRTAIYINTCSLFITLCAVHIM